MKKIPLNAHTFETSSGHWLKYIQYKSNKILDLHWISPISNNSNFLSFKFCPHHKTFQTLHQQHMNHNWEAIPRVTLGSKRLERTALLYLTSHVFISVIYLTLVLLQVGSFPSARLQRRHQTLRHGGRDITAEISTLVGRLEYPQWGWSGRVGTRLEKPHVDSLTGVSVSFSSRPGCETIFCVAAAAAAEHLIWSDAAVTTRGNSSVGVCCTQQTPTRV